MKKSILILAALPALSVLLNCGPQTPMTCEQEATQKEQEKCERESALFMLMLLNRRTAASPAATPAATATQTINFTEESAFTLNDTFLMADSMSLPTASTIQAISGRINVEGDVDIYSVSYTSGTAPAIVIDISKPGTAAVCVMYTNFGPSALNSGTPDGSLVSAGVVSANITPVVLDKFSRTHLYIRCSGLLNETYTVRLAYSVYN